MAVLVMGHMRCGSTLLIHVLLANPDLIGCGERNVPYRGAQDFDKLEIASRVCQRAPFRRVRYAVDQINHDHLTPDPELLADRRVRCIFLIREPNPSIHSILNLTRKFYEPWTEAKAAGYYASRLDSLARYAGIVGRNRFLAMRYGDFVLETKLALRRLESFLSLDSPLHEHYSLQKFTGYRGDPTEMIRSGNIQRNRLASAPGISGDEFERASTAFRACSEALGIGVS